MTGAIIQETNRNVLVFMVTTFITSAVHRILATPYLAEPFHLELGHFAKAMIIGFSSDLWVSCLLGIAALPIILLSQLAGRKILLATGFVFTLLVGIAGTSHQAYVEFFGVPMIPFHLSYMLDTDFVGANYLSIFNWRSALIICLGPIAFFAIQYRTTIKRPSLWLLFAVCASLSTHVLQIRYRVQWHIPEPMQAHAIESIYIRWTNQIRANPLTRSQVIELWGEESPGQIFFDPVSYRQDHKDQEFDRVLDYFLQEIRTIVGANKKPLILTYLMESFRAVDASIYRGGHAPVTTPAFDQFARDGLLFSNAWSSGIVTRGAQEALWCGYPGATTTSAMRGRTDIVLNCLPQTPRVSSFWYHGGEGRFDNQQAYWERQGVSDFLTNADFPEETARTGWGVSDLALVRLGLERLDAHMHAATEPYVLGMMLSVTNHIPWTIPSDYVGTSWQPANAVKHPSAHTSGYADMALGQLIQGMKERGLWENALIVVVGDHGIRAPALTDMSATNPQQLGHVAMAVGGGITTRVLEKLDLSQRVIGRAVSQIDIAAFLALMIGAKTFKSMGQPLFTQRTMPVFTDLGESIYFPEEDTLLTTNAILTDSIESDSQLTKQRAYFKSFRLALESWPSHRAN